MGGVEEGRKEADKPLKINNQDPSCVWRNSCGGRDRSQAAVGGRGRAVCLG